MSDIPILHASEIPSLRSRGVSNTGGAEVSTRKVTGKLWMLPAEQDRRCPLHPSGDVAHAFDQDHVSDADILRRVSPSADLAITPPSSARSRQRQRVLASVYLDTQKLLVRSLQDISCRELDQYWPNRSSPGCRSVDHLSSITHRGPTALRQLLVPLFGALRNMY
jgi:hypothetical protein